MILVIKWEGYENKNPFALFTTPEKCRQWVKDYLKPDAGSGNKWPEGTRIPATVTTYYSCECGDCPACWGWKPNKYERKTMYDFVEMSMDPVGQPAEWKWFDWR